jgi:parallel beta-helix repeat protein
MNTKQWMKATLTVLLSGVALALSRGTAQAISCGDTLGPGGSYTLTADVLNCPTTAALQVVGPVQVDLNGHTISCASYNSFGIQVLGKKAIVTNGRVVECGVGVLVQGSGRHFIGHIVAQNDIQGFAVYSPSRLEYNTAAGISVAGPSPAGYGFMLWEGHNSLRFNQAYNNKAAGFRVEGAGNHLFGNTAAYNYNGFTFSDTAHYATVSSNIVTNNRGPGVEFNGDHGTLKHNTVTNNEYGIQMYSDANNKIFGNTVTGNTAFDLWEHTFGCGTNVWTANTFGTANDGCVQ